MARQLRRQDTAGIPDDMELPGKRYGFGVSWTAVEDMPRVDLDLQCVVVNSTGAIVDCAYYNNLKAARSITHSGDEITGGKVGIDEQVWVGVPRLPADVEVLVFVVAAYAGGALQDIANGVFHVFDNSVTNEIAKFDLDRSPESVKVVATMFRTTDGWTLRIIDEPAQEGQHFMDILDLLAQVIRVHIPSAPKRQKVAFAMEKGDIMDLPKAMDAITVGLGWDTGGEAGEVDLDVSAVMLDEAANEVDTVFFGKLENVEHGITHTGDNLTGEGDGDDEQIVVSLTQIGEVVRQVVFVVNIYTRGQTFKQVENPYCRVVDNMSGNELCRYMLNEAGDGNGLIISKIAREVTGRWGFHALGLPCTGRTYKDSLRHIQQVCVQDTKGFRERGGTLDIRSAGMFAAEAIAGAAFGAGDGAGDPPVWSNGGKTVYPGHFG